MATQLHTVKGNTNNKMIYFTVQENGEMENMKPSGTMITDSDRFSFVYLMETDDGYLPLHFTEEVWPLMEQVLHSEQDPMLEINNESIQLIRFVEELTMLVYNIEGNHNYGEQFSASVEQAFSSFLQNAE